MALRYLRILLFSVTVVFILQSCTSTAVKAIPADQFPEAPILAGNMINKETDVSAAARVRNPDSIPDQTQTENDDTFIRLPEDPSSFWKRAMNVTVAERYREKRGITYCNVYVKDTINLYFGKLADILFPRGLETPNITHRRWEANPALYELSPEKNTILDIQYYADQGYLVIMTYYNNNGPGHIAFVASNNLQMFTNPPINNFEGQNSQALPKEWLPLVAQAGTFTGITSVAYASNGWLRNNMFETGTVKFYLVKKL